MATVKDPEGNEASALHKMVDFKGQHVLEIGCGEGRVTWHYADHAAQVTGIDPDGDSITKAQESLPEPLKGRVTFLQSTLQDFASSIGKRKFDIALLSWSF